MTGAFASRLAACAAAACLSFPGPVWSAEADNAGKLKDSAEITFYGYRSLPGARGVVFVELSDPVKVEVSRSGQIIEYKLVGASVPLRNNRNPLLLRDFDSSALSAVLVPDRPARGRGAKTKGPKGQPSVRLVITLRGQASPTYRLLDHGDGAALEVELPASSAR